jgi:hypothetical protein
MISVTIVDTVHTVAIVTDQFKDHQEIQGQLDRQDQGDQLVHQERQGHLEQMVGQFQKQEILLT